MKEIIFAFGRLFCILFIITVLNISGMAQGNVIHTERIDLAGKWNFQIDSLDKGISEQWFNTGLKDYIQLPGSMTTNNKGNDIDVNTPWTGSIIDRAYFTQPQYAKYREKGNIKIPFWLQPIKYYSGAAWYQKKFVVPASWNEKIIELFLERTHWETKAWVDEKPLGMQNSLATPHVYLLGKLSAGEHVLTICIDNRIKAVNPGPDSHSISDHTQTNWNGMIGQLYMEAKLPVHILDVQMYPDIAKKQVLARVTLSNTTGQIFNGNIVLQATLINGKGELVKPMVKNINWKGDSTTIEVVYLMGSHPLLWDEFHPNLYNMNVTLLKNGKRMDEKNAGFGMRHFSVSGTQFTINGRLTFLRGTLECAIFPKTGYPATDTASWSRIFRICRSYGLNHMRFHSWCPPQAAFEAADRAGFYLQIECSSWANSGAVIGDGTPLDQYIYDESNLIVKNFGNHPSFCLLLYGNEPAGKKLIDYLTGFVNYWKNKDDRRLYSTGSGWPLIKESDFNSEAAPRIQGWNQGLKSIINSQPPSTDYDWSGIISKRMKPTISHEIGQWCVYPDFKEIPKYTGVLKAKNFEIFRETLSNHGMLSLADSFLLASGKLQALCYKADIEAALRTPGFGGFQLLDLHDFPGQGTALVGVLNAFWQDKGYINAKTYNRFCNSVVPLARLKKLIYQNNEDFIAKIQVANFGETVLNESIHWKIKNTAGKILWEGDFTKSLIPIGNSFIAGELKQSLASIKQAGQFILNVSVGKFENSWEFFVYPAKQTEVPMDILVTQQLDKKALQVLNDGGKVLLTLKKGTVKADKGGNIQIGFSSIFWNTAWTNSQPPVTMGILCNPQHPALAAFPTQYYSNYQWYDGMSHSSPIMLDSIGEGIRPIVRVIDDWVTARSLGLLFECKIGKGKLLVSGIDLLIDKSNRQEAKQLLFSLVKYMSSDKFCPTYEAQPGKIMNVFDFK